LIDELGHRGRDAGKVGVHRDQALVLVNRGGGNGIELMALANEIRENIERTFSVTLEIEPIVL